MYSKIIIAGNIGGEVTMRYTPGGDPVTSFSLAVNKTWTKDGVKQEKVTWWRVTCWRKLAEVAGQYLTKGQRVLVEGEDVEVRPYTDKNGAGAASLDLTASTIKFLSTKGETAEIDTSAPAVVPGRTVDEIAEAIPF
jgi:single-strand DNA-binding protein